MARTDSKAPPIEPFRLTADEWHEGCALFEGRCLSCRATAMGVEPDAERYRCEVCDAREVYGLEQLLIMGLVEVDEEEPA